VDTQLFWDSQSESASVYDLDLGWGQARFAEMLRPSLFGKRVLDCGCGAGAYSKFLADCGAHVTGIDFSQAMIRAAKRNFPEIEFIEANILTTELPGRFDVITGSAFLHEIDSSDTPRLIDVFNAHMSPTGFGWFQENSFFNPLARLLRSQVVGRLGVPRFGSVQERPFDPERWMIYRNSFRYCDRSAEAFVLFSRIWSYFIRHGDSAPWIAIDKAIGKLPGDRIKRYWSYIQHIYFSNHLAKDRALGR
jgi:SAM-dependent methyltransferase